MKSRKIAIATVLACAAAGSQAQSAGPTDPQIAEIVVTANQVDIDAGKLAMSRSQSEDVKAFAQEMVKDHGAVNKSATVLVHKLKVTPEASDTNQSLKKGGADNLAGLKKLNGAECNRAYIDHEVTYHEAVIDAIDKTLIPNANNVELKALIEKSRPPFVDHLDHAKRLQTSMGKTGG